MVHTCLESDYYNYLIILRWLMWLIVILLFGFSILSFYIFFGVKGVKIVRCTFVKTRNLGIETIKIKNNLNDYIKN